MMQIQTTLVPGAPWPESFPPSKSETLVPGMRLPNSSRIGMIYKKRVRPTKQPPRLPKDEVYSILRKHISGKPGQSMSKIRADLGWSQSKTERCLTALRNELGNGYFLKSSLKEVAK